MCTTLIFLRPSNGWALTRGAAPDRRGGSRAVGFNALLDGIRFGPADDASCKGVLHLLVVLDQARGIVAAGARNLMAGLADRVDGWISHWLLPEARGALREKGCTAPEPR